MQVGLGFREKRSAQKRQRVGGQAITDGSGQNQLIGHAWKSSISLPIEQCGSMRGQFWVFW